MSLLEQDPDGEHHRRSDELGVDLLGAAGWTLGGTRRFLDDWAAGRPLAMAGGPQTGVQSVPFQNQVMGQVNQLLNTPQRTYRYLETSSSATGRARHWPPLVPILASGALAGLLTRAGAGEEAAPVLAAGETGAADALDGYEGGALAQEGVTPAVRDDLVNSRAGLLPQLGVGQRTRAHRPASQKPWVTHSPSHSRAARYASEALSLSATLRRTGRSERRGTHPVPRRVEPCGQSCGVVRSDRPPARSGTSCSSGSSPRAHAPSLRTS